MIPIIDAEAARRRRWDVIIAGSSFAAMFFARGLPDGLSVLFVEKGRVQPHDDLLRNGFDAADPITQINSSGHHKAWVANSVFGGNSNCWWACTPRMLPSDFALASRHGIGTDWPLGYDALAPFYDRVEAIMEVSGGGSDRVLPRSAPFPHPPHAPSRTDRALQAKAPDQWWAQPTARASGGSRAPCCANGVCHRCPVDAKFTILNGIEHFTRPGHHLLPNTELRAARLEGGRATGALLRQDERDFEIGGDMVALGANAFFNAAILLRSGVGNPRVGQGLNEQAGRYAQVDHDDFGPFGGTSITGHGYALYDGPHRSDAAAVLLEVYNAPPAVRAEPGKWTACTQIKMIAEDLPQARNRVTLVDDAPVLEWHGHSDYALRGLDRAVAALPDLMPQGAAVSRVSGLTPTEAHIMGGHVMADRPADGVVDADLKVHGAAGLLALGAGAFPTSAPANPTLTLSALSLRAGGRA
jgi:choline dehydrogenase-like flavoprotein